MVCIWFAFELSLCHLTFLTQLHVSHNSTGHSTVLMTCGALLGSHFQSCQALCCTLVAAGLARPLYSMQ
jgi:hypothetical protein